ncbi:MAG: type I DNA topoisomerase [Candidatus Moranbacteria bacterium]|nr:type I DNA topoisomerase [Candidatus Moranbacteria bacterium]
MKLIIVESPTKARTISKFLEKIYTVKSSYGHVRDLPKSEMGIDIENDFNPRYIIPTKARTKVSELKELSKKSDEVILATDEDREGEAIAWHLVEALGLNASRDTNVKRIAFHEITKNAILKALESPRNIDMDLVDAQQARRILDRLVGYELSPFLWKKVKRGLSAGRVQSVALRIIVEREREIEKFEKENYWAITAVLSRDKNNFEAGLAKIGEKNVEEIVTLKLFAGDYKTKKTVIDSEARAREIIADLEKANYKVKNITEKETSRYPSAPFTTSTLQQAANANLGFSAKFTMSVAQKLYEQGHITYMRTDSVNLSLELMLAAKKIITKLFGKNYALPNPRFYKTKSKGAQEAHEAIRPTYPGETPEDLKNKLDPAEYKLYNLIWKKMIACQMQPAIFDSVKAEIEASYKGNYLLRANGSTLKFDGFLKAYNSKAPGENILPKMKIGDKLNLIKINFEEKATTPPPRYSEATLIKVLEENGIGRPSTYAPIISTIIERKYVDKNEEKRLCPLEIGKVVNDLLVEHFPEIVDIKFTANIEEYFDEIAEGKNEWVPVIRKFYTPFHKHLEAKTKEVKRENVLEKLDRPCPDCGGDLIVKFGRFGKFIACANFPNCKYTEKTAEEKKVDEENSGVVCDLCGAPMTVKRGRYGTFLGCSKYPECKGIKKIENKIGMKCPKCEKGEIVERKSKRGKTFYGCNRWPECDFALWNKPTGETCPQCGSLLGYSFKNKIKCSRKECDFEK